MSKNPNQKLKLLYLYQIPLSAKAFIRTSKHSRILVWM